MAQTSVFKNNRSQAIRIPKALALPDDVTHVEIVRDGENLIVMPIKKSSWDAFFKLPRMDADFMVDREQPPMQERDWDAE